MGPQTNNLLRNYHRGRDDSLLIRLDLRPEQQAELARVGDEGASFGFMAALRMV
jgi:hypothetical protein